MSAAGIAAWFLSLATGAVLLTWLYNGSSGSIFVVALFHASVDVALGSDIASPLVVNVTGALITACALGIVVATGWRTLSRRGTMERQDDGGTLAVRTRRTRPNATSAS